MDSERLDRSVGRNLKSHASGTLAERSAWSLTQLISERVEYCLRHASHVLGLTPHRDAFLPVPVIGYPRVPVYPYGPKSRIGVSTNVALPSSFSPRVIVAAATPMCLKPLRRNPTKLSNQMHVCHFFQLLRDDLGPTYPEEACV